MIVTILSRFVTFADPIQELWIDSSLSGFGEKQVVEFQTDLRWMRYFAVISRLHFVEGMCACPTYSLWNAWQCNMFLGNEINVNFIRTPLVICLLLWWSHISFIHTLSHSLALYSVLSYFFISCRGNPWIGSGDQPEKDKHARDIPFLDKYSMERWEV